MPVKIIGVNASVNSFVILDEGSTVSLIDKEITRSLGLKGPIFSFNLKGINDSEGVKMTSEKVNFVVETTAGKFRINNVITVENLSLPVQSISSELALACKKDLDIVISSYSNACPMLLLGQDNWKLITSKITRTLKNFPAAISQTGLGWCIHGPVSEQQKSASVTLCAASTSVDSELDCSNENLDNLITEYFVIDSLGVKECIHKNANDEKAREILGKTSKRLGNGWEVGLLWKNEDEVVPESKVLAEKRLYSLEKKLDNDPEYAKLYYKEMNRLFELGFATKLHNVSPNTRHWYLPHFGVRNINKPNRIRLVFDAAAKYSGMSLNDQLLSGPDLLESLLGILMRFRQHKFAVIGDIKDMFLKITIIKRDRESQRFLWRGNDRHRKPDDCAMVSMLFGAKSSPCSALYIKNRNAMDFESNKPFAAKSIERDSYMDDYIVSISSEAEAVTLVRDIIEINKAANFEMHGWASNNKEVLKEVHEFANESDSSNIDFDKDQKVLGLSRNIQTDFLGFKLDKRKISEKILRLQQKPSKREFLSVIMSIYDPLGLLAPFSIRSRIIMQKIWISGIKWDDELRDEEFILWKDWIGDLEKVKNCKIPRHYNFSQRVCDISLHVFCDASIRAYAAVAYWRFEFPGEKAAHVSLIGAKSRVAPIKPLTIPRLELQAAVLACRFLKFIQKHHDIIPRYRCIYSDSMTVLSELQSDIHTKPSFVAHRVGEILESSRVDEWYWVPSKFNPADDATKKNNATFEVHGKWFPGPPFLTQPKPEWPTKALDSFKKLNTLIISTHQPKELIKKSSFLPPCTYFSKWIRLVRASARVLSIVDFLCGRTDSNEVTLEHLDEAELHWILEIQKVFCVRAFMFKEK